MPLKELFANFRDKYMTNQVNQRNFPAFESDEEKKISNRFFRDRKIR